MKFKWLFPLLAAVAASPLTSYANDMSGKFSGGIKLGMFLVDSAAADDFEDATGVSVDIDNGLGFGLHGDYMIRDNWYVDVEFTSVSVDTTFSSGMGEVSDDIDIRSFAVYGAYRSTGQLYYLGKLGLLSESVSASGDVDESEVGLSFAIGGGYKFSDVFSLEAEFTSIEKDVAFIGATARYTFK